MRGPAGGTYLRHTVGPALHRGLGVDSEMEGTLGDTKAQFVEFPEKACWKVGGRESERKKVGGGCWRSESGLFTRANSQVWTRLIFMGCFL